MLWLKKLNHGNRQARNGADEGPGCRRRLEAKLAVQKQLAESTGDAEQAWKAEVWDKMLQRIRKMESMLNPL